MDGGCARLLLPEADSIKELSDASFANDILTLDFSVDPTITIEAGKAYIVKWENPDNYEPYDGENAETCSDMVNPLFKNVTVRNESNPKLIIKDKDGKWPEDESDIFFGIVFWGSYNPTVITDDFVLNKQLLYLGADNNLYYPATQMTIGAFRGFFQLYGITAGDLPTQASRFVLNFGEDEATGVREVKEVREVKDNSWYTLDGRRLHRCHQQDWCHACSLRDVL